MKRRTATFIKLLKSGWKLHRLSFLVIGGGIVLGVVAVAWLAAVRLNAAAYVFPLKVSANGRYLVDQNNTAFFYAADTTWSLLSRLSVADAKKLIDLRRDQGFTVIQSYMMVWASDDAGPRGPAFENGDVTRPIESFFAGNDEIINYAASRGMVLMIGALENGSNRDLSAQAASTYGSFLANRYKNTKNILWFVGGDDDPNANVEAIKATGSALKAGNSANLISAHYWGLVQPFFYIQDQPWYDFYAYQWNGQRRPWTYEDALEGYNHTPTKPWLNIEPSYEPQTADGQTVSAFEVRNNGWWSMLSGAMGVVYGGPRNAWNIGAESAPNWADVERPAATQTGNISKILRGFTWEKLVPDQNNTTFVDGRGTYGGTDFVAGGRADDGSLVAAYMPSARPLSVNLKRLSAAATAQWFDPVSGTAAGPAQSVANSGTQTFSPSGANSAGDDDWVLIVYTPAGQAAGGAGPTSTPNPTLTPSPTPQATITNAPRPSTSASPNPGSTSTPAATTTPPPPSATPGDLDANGAVDIADLTLLLTRWDDSPYTVDINHDNDVNVYDLSTLLSHWQSP